MKLRQKLAVVLASAMVITAVPVTTMAKSTNELSKTISIREGSQITAEDKVNLEVKITREKTETPTVFFVNATDFEFKEDAYSATNTTTAGQLAKDGIEIEYLSESQLRVEVKVGAKASNNETLLVEVPVIGKVLKGNPAIAVDGEDSIVTSGKYSLSTVEIAGKEVLTAKAGDAKNISVEGFGVIADITLEEKEANSLAGKTVYITLPNSSDLIFNSKYKDGAKVTIKGERGLASVATEVTAKYFEEDSKKDDKKLAITFPSTFATDTRGSVVLKGIEVQAEDRKDDVSTGEVKVTVTAKEDDTIASTKLVVANVADFGVSYTVKEVKELTAGQGTTKVKVKIKENAVDTLNKNRPIYFTLEEGYFATDVITSDQAGFSWNEDKDEITLTLKDNADFEEGKINEFEFEVEVAAKATHEGPVVMVASSRNFEEDLKLEVATVTPAVEIKADPITVKAGLKDQVGGKIVIKETAEEKLAKNKQIIIKADDAWGFAIEDAKVEVTDGDIQIEDKVNKDGEIIITVKRTSDEASEITISDIKVTTNRTIPEGTFDFLVGGNAISQDKNVNDDVTTTRDDERFEDALTIEDFIVVGTKNTEDLPNAAAAKEIVLTVGSTDYTVNGEAKKADAAAFIDANNRTMVPVRFVAEEFGKIDFGTVNGVGTVTVFKDGAVLQFQNGSNVMNKNGIAIPMDTNVVIKDGRTYVPFKYVADGLGINYSFDAATKSITFTNQSK